MTQTQRRFEHISRKLIRANRYHQLQGQYCEGDILLVDSATNEIAPIIDYEMEGYEIVHIYDDRISEHPIVILKRPVYETV